MHSWGQGRGGSGGDAVLMMGDVEENVTNCFTKGLINHGISADLTNFLRKER